jgi:hypothetical protein
MNKKLYLISSHEVDTDSAFHSLIGAHKSLEAAVTRMQKAIYDEFEDIKEWWEDEEDDDSVEEQYQGWIEENYIDDECTLWSYTDDDPVEHTFQIHSVEVDNDHSELYALLCTRVDGMDNKTEVLGVYSSQNAADSALEAFEPNEEENDDDDFEVVTSIKKFIIEE